MLPVMAGYCYFDIRNYDAFSGEYNLYIDWDMELMEYLAYPLPSGGYFVKVTSEQAHEFNELGEGMPVYMKLLGRNGQIYSYRTYLVYRGRPYSIEFSGAELIPFEEKIQKIVTGGSQRGGVNVSVGGSQKTGMGVNSSQRFELGVTGSQRFSIGSSQRLNMSVTGSQRFSIGGSQRLGMGVTGSQRFSIGSSQRLGMGVTGSQRLGMGVTGSQRLSIGGSQRFNMSVTGSQRFSIGGSQGFSLGINGSQKISGGATGSHRPTVTGKLPDVYKPTEDWTMIPKEWQLINRTRRPDTDKGGNARLGYGLDLI